MEASRKNSKNRNSQSNGKAKHFSPQSEGGLLADSPALEVSKPADLAPTSVVDDTTVTVNLAMADLMAYLQVVANNSSNLPLTRRDDPELGRTVSSLNADEYAKKCSAFIPSDVKIISGSFTRYGRVWDLPTSEEYAPSDGAQEPGVSHGGACGNALLKVFYDMELETNNKNLFANYTNTANLFDDDDDEEEADLEGMNGDNGDLEKSFESLITHDINSPSSITWAELLRRMKDEIHEIGHFQEPFITSSRKFDLNQQFCIVQPSFDKNKSKKRSLLIGCNYNDIPDAQLKASHDDVRSMKDFIVNVYGFPETKGLMTVLLDDDEHKHPTHENITEALKALSEQSQPGDSVFVYFSGHGCRVLDAPIDADVESYDESLIPSDYLVSGMIRDTLIFKTLLAPMRHGVTVTALIDCCDTGMVLDLPYSWSTKNDRSDVPPKMTINDDFSFVRFLKVIKTLYESSTFTQLGQTVRSAIYGNPNLPNRNAIDDDDHTHTDDSTFGGGSLVTMDENDVGDDTRNPSKARGFLNILNACQSPADPTNETIRQTTSDGIDYAKEAISTYVDGPSLFQQVLSCTLLGNPAESDDDSYHRNATYGTYDDYTDDEYDSVTDDGGALHARDYDRGDGHVENRRSRR